jgi:phosphoglycerate dehydrogenase-like enzyme
VSARFAAGYALGCRTSSRASRATRWASTRESWLEGRLVVTPHSAFVSPEAYEDIKRKSAETMRAVLIDNKLQNVIPPEMD